MNAKQLKEDLEQYKGYHYKGNSELKVIEKGIFQKMSNWLRPITTDVPVLKSMGNNEENILYKEEALKNIEGMKKVSKEYHVPELIINFLSGAHTDWMIEHKDDLTDANLKNAGKFVPLELLAKSEFDKYLSILIPIFNCVDIDVDVQKVEKELLRRQLLFMIEKEIFSKEDLKYRIMDTVNFNPEIAGLLIGSKNSKIEDYFKQEKNAQMIADSVSENCELNLANKFKQVFCQNSDDVGILDVKNVEDRMQIYKFADNLGQKKIGIKKIGLPRPNKPVTKDIYELARFGGIIFAKNVKRNDYKYVNCNKFIKSVVQFIPYKECSEEQKRLVDRRERKLQKYISKMQKNNKSDIPGIVSLVIVKEKERYYNNKLSLKGNKAGENIEIIQIPVTKNELIKMRILPEEIGWEKEKKAKINSYNKVYCAVSDKLEEFNVRQNVESHNGKNDFRNGLVELAKRKDINESQEKPEIQNHGKTEIQNLNYREDTKNNEKDEVR